MDTTAPPAADAVEAPRRPGRRRLLVAAAAGLALVVVAAATVWWVLGRGPQGPIADAVDALPTDTLRIGFTDWAAVSSELEAPSDEDALDRTAVDDFLSRAYDADVTTTSPLTESFAGLAANIGVTPAEAEWEAYGQSRKGAVDVLRLSDSVDLDEVEDTIRDAGWEEPDDPDGVWAGSEDLVATFDEPLGTLQQNLAILHDQRLLLMSDDATYLEQSLPSAQGEASSALGIAGVSDLVGAVEGSDAVQLWTRDFVCDDLAMSNAGPVDREEGDRLVEDAGGVHPLEGMALSRSLGRTALLAFWYADEEQASDDLQPRTDLARGDAPGQGGTFGDRFEVTDAVQDGPMVVLDLRESSPTFMADLAQGPVLYATC